MPGSLLVRNNCCGGNFRYRKLLTVTMAAAKEERMWDNAISKKLSFPSGGAGHGQRRESIDGAFFSGREV